MVAPTEQWTLDITGAGSGLGEALAMQYKDKQEDVATSLIGGRRADVLQRVGAAANAREVVSGDLFPIIRSLTDDVSRAYSRIIWSKADVIAHMAAINLDALKDPIEQEELEGTQNEFLLHLIEHQSRQSSSTPRLLVVANSVTAYFAEQNDRARKFPYMRMKMQQADILRRTRQQLKEAGIDLAVVYPGAIRTDMMSHLGDEEAIRMANMFGKRTKVPGKKPEGIIQDSIFQPEEVASAMAALIDYHLVNGEVPNDYQEWIISNHDDLKFDPNA